jgi:hypothetical protein
MKVDTAAALFLALGQTADTIVETTKDLVPKDPLLISAAYDLAEIVPDSVRAATSASEAYKLFFVFEEYLRQLIIEVLTKEGGTKTWWDYVPQDVKDEVSRLEHAEEVKSWMALGSRDKSALMTLPQLLKVIEYAWKDGFDEIVRDKGLIQEARLLVHLRNMICHMSVLSNEEVDRIKQTIRDWFRSVAP